MLHRLATALVALALVGTASVSAAGENKPPAVGGVLPEFTLPAPEAAEQRAYLGLEGEGSFSIPGLRAEVVIVEIFNMY